MVAVEYSIGLKGGGVGAGGRFGQAIAAHALHRNHRRQILLLHFSGSEAIDHPACHVVDRNEGAGRGAAIGHRLHDQRRLEPSKADSACFLAHVDRAEPELRRLADRVARKDMLFVPLGRERSDGVGRELLRHLLDLELVVGEIELGHCAGALGSRTCASKTRDMASARGFLLKQSFEPKHVTDRGPLDHSLAECAEARPAIKPAEHLLRPARHHEQIRVGKGQLLAHKEWAVAELYVEIVELLSEVAAHELLHLVSSVGPEQEAEALVNLGGYEIDQLEHPIPAEVAERRKHFANAGSVAEILKDDGVLGKNVATIELERRNGALGVDDEI